VKQSINPEAMKTNEMEKPSPDGSLIRPAADAVASVEPEALSRFVGEGGPEAPVPVMELVDIPLKNSIPGSKLMPRCSSLIPPTNCWP
jgi:hypothetical protein